MFAIPGDEYVLAIAVISRPVQRPHELWFLGSLVPLPSPSLVPGQDPWVGRNR